MEDIIDIIVTETTNTIEITAQPNDEIIDVNIIDNREDIVLNVTPTVVEININSLTSNFGVEWGDITGTLADQTDLNNALALKANLVGGKVPASELPSYVDDVVEVATFSALPATGEIGKIYVILDTNKIYRWSGSVYVEIADSTAVWGAITGTLSSQTDLQSALDAKQNQLNGTGFVKASGTTISYDNSTYLTTSDAASTYLPLTGGTLSGILRVDSALRIKSGSANGILFETYSTNELRIRVTPASTTFDMNLVFPSATRTYTYPNATGTIALTSDLSAYVPYTGATANVDLGAFTLLAAKGTFSSSGSADTVGITHSSGSGIALNISKAGNGEGIYVNKSSGSGNAVTIVGTLNATTLVKNGGTSSQFLKADGSVDSSTYLTTGTAASTYVPYTGATGAVNLGAFDLTVNSVKVGRGAGGVATNTALGNGALNSNTTGGNNTAIGYLSLLNNTTGGNNTATGKESLYTNTTGENNVANGYQALNKNTTGSDNTAIGNFALSNNTTASGNIAIGVQSLFNNTTGTYNTSVGFQVNINNTTGNNITAIGFQANTSNTTGNDNTAIGYQSLVGNTTGSYNTAIGKFAGQYITTGSNNTLIGGYGGTSAMANNIVLSDGAGNIKYQWNGTTNTLFGTTTLTGALSGTSASFSSSVTAYGNASSSSAFNLYNTTGSSGTAQYYADFGNGSGFVAGRILRGNGASGYEANGLNIDTHTGMQIKLNALGGSGGAFNVSGGNVGIGTTSPNHLLTLSATASNKTEIGLYNTFNDAANRNWAIATNQTAFGDFHLMQSNAKDGNPTSAGTSRLMINASGNVGIGTTAPGARLEVTTPTTGTEAENIRLEMNTGAIPASSGLNFRFGSVNGATIYGVGENGSTGASSMRFYTHNGTSSAERMRITSGGVVQVNNSMILAGGGSNGVISIGDTTTASNGIYINTQTFTHRFAKFSFQGNPMGEIFYNGINTTYAVSGSDFRLKKNIDKWDENVLDLFKDINPKLFNWNFQKDSDTKSKGFIAQEMTSKFPEAYHLGSDNMYLYNPSGMVVYLIKAVQELEAKIKTLETK